MNWFIVIWEKLAPIFQETDRQQLYMNCIQQIMYSGIIKQSVPFVGWKCEMDDSSGVMMRRMGLSCVICSAEVNEGSNSCCLPLK